MLRVEGLTKIFANTTDAIAGGIRDAGFALEPGAFFTLLGPSGCGKTTTLRCLAGLETPDSGTIVLDERALFDRSRRVNVPMNKRAIGMVFQSYAIWPHMTVAENVAFPLTVNKERRFSRSEIEGAVKEALATVNLDGYQSRPATRLSGGEQQRVALARAIVFAPRLLLLDEPLSNLDAQLREEMRAELKRLQRQIGITTVYVTHDQAEALTLSDRIAVINRGSVVQIGDPRAIYFRPESDFVARFVGATNLLPGRLLGVVDGRGEAEAVSGHRLSCIVPHRIADMSAVAVSIRPEHIRLLAGAPPGPPDQGENRLSGRVVGVSFLGNACRVDIDADGTPLQVTIGAEVDLPADRAVTLSFPAEKTVVVPRLEGGN
jgi:iron(III) transport system ATP-binding protein